MLILFAVLAFAPAAFAQADADALDRQVVKLFSEGKYEEALPMAERAVELRAAALGKNALKTGESVRNLAYVQLAAGRTKTAAGSFERAIAIFSETPALSAKSRDELGAMLERAGAARFELGQSPRAVELLRRAVAERDLVHGADSLKSADASFLMANVLYSTRDYKAAATSYWRALETRQSRLGTLAWDTEDASIRYLCSATKAGTREEANMRMQSLPKWKPEGAKASAVRGGVINGRAKRLPRPEYPVGARNALPQGDVTVWTVIDEGGRVVFACTISGDRFFWESAERAAYASEFAPTMLEGNPVKVVGILVYRFSR